MSGKGLSQTGDTNRRSVVFELLQLYCTEHGLRLTAGDGHGHAGCVENANGKRWLFKGTRFDINPLGCAEIANDKAYSLHFLEKAGVPVPESLLVFATEIRKGNQMSPSVSRFAEKQGFPLFLKPNIGREGRDVMRIHGGSELHNALQLLSHTHMQLLVQQEIQGRDLRVIILDGEVLCAIERKAPHVTGDGRQSIAALIGHDRRALAEDSRIDAALTLQGLTRASVPEAGKSIALLPVTNLSAGGTAEIVTDKLGSEFPEIARKAADTLGLRYAGVDMIVRGGDWTGADAVVLEVNAAPGLNNLFRQGPREAESVRSIYATLFNRLFEK